MEDQAKAGRLGRKAADWMVEALGRLSGTRLRAGLLHALVALALTWPLALNPASHIPTGSESSPTVPLFNLWVLGWNATWFAHPGHSYWDAPIFHPVPGSLAFSDPQPLSGLLAAPAWKIAPALAYNFVLVLFLTLNGLCVRSFLFARGLGAVPSLLAGVLAQALPFLTHERGVLQLQPVFAMVWTFDQLFKLAQSPRLRYGIGFGLAAAATYLTSAYYALFLLLCLLPAIIALFRCLVRPPASGALLAGVALGGILVLPVGLAQKWNLDQMGFRRGAATIEQFSASGGDYLSRSPALLLQSGMRTASGNHLWPGFLLAGLAAWGAFQGLVKPATRRLAAFFVAAGCLAFFLSFGLHLSLGGWRPYEAVRMLIPGMENLRSPFRFAVCVQLFLALLGGIAFQSLFARRRSGLALLLAALALLELAPRPARLVGVPPLPSAAPVHSPAVFIPYVEGTRSKDYFETVAAMCLLLPSRVHLVNGYSGYFPQLNRQLRRLLADFPTTSGLSALRALGTRSILVQLEDLDFSRRQRLEDLVSRHILEPEGSTLGLAHFRLAQTGFRPAGDYQGSWRIQVGLRSEEIEVVLSPAQLEEGYYVLSPRAAPLVWELRLTGPSGAQWNFVRCPPGAQLLHRDESGLRLAIPRPKTSGEYLIQVHEAGSRKPWSKAAFRLPPTTGKGTR